MDDKIINYIESEIKKIDRINFPLEKTQKGQTKILLKQTEDFLKGFISESEYKTLQREASVTRERVRTIEGIEDHFKAIDQWRLLLRDVTNKLDEGSAILAYQDLIDRYRSTNQYKEELRARFEIMGRLCVDDNSIDKYWREVAY